MNVLLFTNTDAQTLIADQSGQHRLAPVELTDGRWFLMEDVLTEGLFHDKLNVTYTTAPFADIASLMPTTTEEQP
jgi:hypothetical protein